MLPLLGRDEFEEQAAGRRAGDAWGQEAGALRILVADDHEIVRHAIADMLSSEEEFEIVGHAANGREAVAKAWELLPDVLLMDVRMPEMDGMEATRRVLEALPGTVVIALSAHEDVEVRQQMMEAGAAAFVDKAAPPDQLMEALRKLGLGKAKE